MSSWSVFLEVSRHHARRSVSYVRQELPLRDAETGQLYGVIERASVRGGRVHIEGWTNALRLRVGDRTGFQRILRPTRTRREPASDGSIADRGPKGFSGEVDAFGCIRIEAQVETFGGWNACRDIRLHGTGGRLRAGLYGIGRTLQAVGRDPLGSLAALRTDEQALRDVLWTERVDTALPHFLHPLEPGIFSRTGTTQAVADRGARNVSVVVPVYNAFDLTRECLQRAVDHADLPARYIVVEDASTDARVRPWLRDWAAAQGGRVELVENDENLGFIGSVNRALDLASGDDVVLLNSDAMVPPRWLSRLLAPLDRADVASVTPMSNDAEILSAPVICAGGPLAEGVAEAVDAAAARLDPLTAQADLPTGVGFCMAMSARFLARVPRLDPVFGAGYGEEVDWCRKTAALGGRHLGLGTLFVEHRSGASFGSARKLELVRRNNARISRRYPGYDAEVQRFIHGDPLLSVRLALATQVLAASGERVPVFLAHALGGGAEMYLERRIARLTAAGQGAVVLRVDGLADVVRLEVHGPLGVTAGYAEEVAACLPFLRALPRKTVIYSCLVSAPNPMEVLRAAVDTVTRPADRLEVLLHDYFPLCPSYTLLNDKGRFCGLPDTATCRQCLAAPNAHSAAPGTDIRDWRLGWGEVLDQADRIEVFSAASRDLLLRTYPSAAANVVLEPHELLAAPPRIARTRDSRTIGVLGNIGYAKGAEVLRRLAEDMRLPPLVVIGRLDPVYAHPRIATHGVYDLAELPELVDRYRIGFWLQPAIWPETFSFTTHEMLATGLPVVSFDLGAQGEAVALAANGLVQPLAGGAPALADRLLKLISAPARPETSPSPQRRSAGAHVAI